MARSLKKGPFADESLLKKVDAMNASGDKSVIMGNFFSLCLNDVVFIILQQKTRSFL